MGFIEQFDRLRCPDPVLLQDLKPGFRWRLQKLAREHLRHWRTATMGRHGTDLCHAIRRTEEIGQGARAAAEPSPLRSAPNCRKDS